MNERIIWLAEVEVSDIYTRVRFVIIQTRVQKLKGTLSPKKSLPNCVRISTTDAYR